MKVLNIIDKVLRIAAFVVFGISLIYLAFKWNSIPDIAGVHFDSDGSFDVYDTKLYIFYPYHI